MVFKILVRFNRLLLNSLVSAGGAELCCVCLLELHQNHCFCQIVTIIYTMAENCDSSSTQERKILTGLALGLIKSFMQ